MGKQVYITEKQIGVIVKVLYTLENVTAVEPFGEEADEATIAAYHQDIEDRDEMRKLLVKYYGKAIPTLLKYFDD